MGMEAVATAANIEGLASAGWMLAGGIAVKTYDKFSEQRPEALLKPCRDKLEEIKSLLAEFTPRKREKVQALARAGKCRSIEAIERDMREFSDDRAELNKRAADASWRERMLPACLSQLRTDINTLRKAVQALLDDTWNTTSMPKKEEEMLAQRQTEHPGQEPGTNAQAPTGGHGWYPLAVIHPPVAQMV